MWTLKCSKCTKERTDLAVSLQRGTAADPGDTGSFGIADWEQIGSHFPPIAAWVTQISL